MKTNRVPLIEIVGSCGVALICLVTALVMWPEEFKKLDADWFQAIFSVIGIFAAVGIATWQTTATRHMAEAQAKENRKLAAENHQLTLDLNRRLFHSSQEAALIQRTTKILQEIELVKTLMSINLTYLDLTASQWRSGNRLAFSEGAIRNYRSIKASIDSLPPFELPLPIMLVSMTSISAALDSLCEILKVVDDGLKSKELKEVPIDENLIGHVTGTIALAKQMKTICESHYKTLNDGLVKLKNVPSML